MCDQIQDSCNALSKFVITDVEERLELINRLINNMHARLEEFQTMICFTIQERVSCTNLLNSICDNQRNLSDLFMRINSVESLIRHVKSTLHMLEKDIERAEEELGYTESTTSKVANIFTPLFKKSPNETHPQSSLQFYETSDYFHASSDSLHNEL